jgi:competence protein ComEA
MDPRAWRLLAIFGGISLIVIGWFWLQGRPSAVQSVHDPAASSALASRSPISGTPISGAVNSGAVIAADEVVVHVAGDVRKPGLQHLPAGSRVADAITAAGGVSTSKAENSVNLARLLIDGEQVIVGAGPQQVSAGQQVGNTQGSGVSSRKVRLNSANQQELETLPGVGPSLAQRILAFRTANGSFHSVDELDDVSGIGPATLTRLRPLLQL